MHIAKQLLPTAFLAAALLAPVNASAGFLSGMDLLESCRPQPVDPVYRLKIAECRGYVVGIADTFDCAVSSRGFTWNSTTTGSQHDMVEKVVKWLMAHPGQLSYQANGLVAAALSEAYPCGLANMPQPNVTAAAQ